MQNSSKDWLDIADPFTGEIAETPIGYAARLTGATRSTVRRWALTGHIPTASQRLLASLVHGVLPDPQWHLFRIRGGSLVNLDTGERFTPLDISTVYLAHQQNAALRSALRDIQRPARRRLELVS